MKFLSLSDVAKIFGINRYSVKRWVDAGLLPAIKINGRLYIEPKDLDTFIKAHKMR